MKSVAPFDRAGGGAASAGDRGAIFRKLCGGQLSSPRRLKEQFSPRRKWA